jgi:hypothetical protein
MKKDRFNTDRKEDSSGRKGKANADRLNSIINSPTESVRSRRSGDTLSSTGTNTSYEGSTAPAGGGSVGTGNASGKSAVDARISSDHSNDYVRSARTGKRGRDKKKGERIIKPGRKNDNLDRDTLGTP